MKQLFLIFGLFLLWSCHAPKEVISSTSLEPVKKPKNIILMIGDGMGLGQISAGLYSNNNQLHMERFKVVGLHKSYSADNLITDSAAGATSFACGIKTYNKAIGVNTDSLPVVTILEEVEKMGFATGLIATSTIVHATPASFAAHEKDRNSYEAIAADFLEVDVDLFIGGGKKYFDKRTIDNRNLYEEFEKKGYYVSDYIREPLELMSLPDQPVLYFTADDSPRKVSEGRDYLPLASALGVNYLKSRSNKGFFLMIEGSQIDWGGHDNDAPYLIAETIDFDAAIGAVLDWAEKDGETLVIVTADHETGGLSINYGSKMNELTTAFTSPGHTGTLIPVFAYGPGASLFGGIYENTAIYDKMKALLGK